MNPSSGFRIIELESDLIFESRKQYNYTRVCLPGLNEGTVQYLSKFGDFYKCNFSQNTFDTQVEIYKNEAIELFKTNFNGTLVNKQYLHRKIELCNIALVEDWHSPIFVVKYKSMIIATTGHNKIYATALRKQKFNLDFDCFVLDLDRNPANYFINIEKITSDDDFSRCIGSQQFAIDISIEKTIHGYVPAIMQFSKTYPISYHDGSFKLALKNAQFFNKLDTRGKIPIEIHDRYSSQICDSSNIFAITYATASLNINTTDNARQLKKINCSYMRFVTFVGIIFDLADLIPYLDVDTTLYSCNNLTYVAFTDDEEPYHKEKLTCPADLLYLNLKKV